MVFFFFNICIFFIFFFFRGVFDLFVLFYFVFKYNFKQITYRPKLYVKGHKMKMIIVFVPKKNYE